MLDLNLEPGLWEWFIFGVLLLILEMFAPGTFFLWMGIAALVVGGLLWVVPELDWQYQLLVFALLSLTSIALSRMYLRRHPITSEETNLNRRGQQQVGKTYLLEEPIIHGNGRVRIGDTLWKVSGPDCAAGETVTVVGVEGTTLRVEPRRGS